MRYAVALALCAAMTLAAASYAADESAAGSATKEPAKIKLFNGKDLTGLKLFIPEKEGVDPASVWSVRDGVIHCTGTPAGYIRTTKQYENYTLSFEWRWAGEPGNSGCLLHIQDKDNVWPDSIESQLGNHNAGDFWVIGEGTDFKEHTDKSTRRVVKKHKHNEKPAGEWNKKVVVCDGNTIKVTVNGLLQNVATGTTLTKGRIGWQSEGAPIEFRNIILKPLKK
jgi:3-keto-disaccharide hydrolase